MNNFTTLTDEELKALTARIEELEKALEDIKLYYKDKRFNRAIVNPIPLMIAERALK